MVSSITALGANGELSDNLPKIAAGVRRRVVESEIVKRILREEISREEYIAYLSDVYCYALHSAQVIALAGARLVLSHPSLSKYLLRHAEEELGHDKWAASDLADLGLTDTEIRNLRPSASCHRMVALEYFYAAHDNPIGLFGWLFVLESLGGDLGSDIAQKIDGALHLEGQGTYFLRGHGEADTKHSRELYQVIGADVIHAEDQAAFYRMATESTELYSEILASSLRSHPEMSAEQVRRKA